MRKKNSKLIEYLNDFYVVAFLLLSCCCHFSFIGWCGLLLFFHYAIVWTLCVSTVDVVVDYHYFQFFSLFSSFRECWIAIFSEWRWLWRKCEKRLRLSISARRKVVKKGFSKYFQPKICFCALKSWNNLKHLSGLLSELPFFYPLPPKQFTLKQKTREREIKWVLWCIDHTGSK